MEKNEPEIIELEQEYAVVDLPKNTVEMTIECTVWQDGHPLRVKTSFDMDEVRRAFQRAADGYIDEDKTFVITDQGREYLESICRGTGI